VELVHKAVKLFVKIIGNTSELSGKGLGSSREQFVIKETMFLGLTTPVSIEYVVGLQDFIGVEH
jgi:hypothetical protein